MNESPSDSQAIESCAAGYKDRSAGMIFFGILTLLLGVLCGLLFLLMVVGQLSLAGTSHPPTNAAPLLLIFSVYGVLAVALIWLGIGSIMARRWARALLLIFSWSWLGVGICAMAFEAFFLPKMMATLSAPPNGPNGQPGLPAGALTGIIVFTVVILIVFFVLLPIVWTCFYSSRHVKATCEARDPVTRWTDACPLPVLGFCLWLGLGVPMFLLMPVLGHGTLPFFGMFLTGLPGSFLFWGLAAIWGFSAWLLYRLDNRGWWLILIAMVLVAISSVLTYARHDSVEVFRQMGYPEGQIEQIRKTGWLNGNGLAWLSSLSVLPLLGYLLFIKKYLSPKAN